MNRWLLVFALLLIPGSAAADGWCPDEERSARGDCPGTISSEPPPGSLGDESDDWFPHEHPCHPEGDFDHRGCFPEQVMKACEEAPTPACDEYLSTCIGGS